MQLKVYINNKLYKTVTVQGDSYDPGFILPEFEADRDSGLLVGFNVTQGIHIRYEKVTTVPKK
jgi:hypothetical protein